MAIRKPTEWTPDEARRHLHALIGEATETGPQPVERPNSQEALIVPVPPWREPQPTTGETLVEFFQRSGLGDAALDLERLPDTVEDFDEWMRRRGTFDDLERLADALLARADESL